MLRFYTLTLEKGVGYNSKILIFPPFLVSAYFFWQYKYFHPLTKPSHFQLRRVDNTNIFVPLCLGMGIFFGFPSTS